ncbi:MAG: restriction endonuclease subunit S [Ruminococcus sp.]|nr:restriction endonuclease subunit S [Ruminococcus sp.]
MLVPKLRFKSEDGTDYPDWKEYALEHTLYEKKEYDTLSSGNPLLTSSRTGLMFQHEYRDTVSTSNQSTLFSVINKNECTYRHMSDDSIFHFNINTLCDKGLVSKEYPVFSTQNRFDLQFIVQHLNSSKKFLEFCRQQKKGGTRTRLYFKTLCNYKMFLPCLEEQQKIADFLSTVDEVIAQSEAEVQNLEQQKKAAMQKIFSQEVRFKREDGTEFSKWKEKELKSVATILMGQSPRGNSVNEEQNGVPLVQGKADILGYGIIPERCTTLPTKVSEPNDIIMTVRAPVGFVAKLGFSACIGRGVCAIKAKEITDYIYYVLQYKESEWKYIEQGSTFTAVNLDDVSSLTIPVPCLEEQQKIAEFLSSYDEAIIYAKQELNKWKELKKGLLQQMFV